MDKFTRFGPASFADEPSTALQQTGQEEAPF
jgi:hypothetical protein